MENILSSVIATPAAVASIISSIMAASAALVAVAITQYITQKKARVQFLTPKLEELYLLINDLSEKNVIYFKLFYLSMEGDEEARQKIGEIDELDLYGHRRAKKIIMLIRLYFPRLSNIHQKLFHAERSLNTIMFSIQSGLHSPQEDFVAAGGRVGHLLRLIEQEIIQNRDYLLGNYFLPKRYKEITDEEFKQEISPPLDAILSDASSNERS